MSDSESNKPVKRGPNRVALAFLFAFALSVGTIIFTGLMVRAPDPGRRERLEALREMRPQQPVAPAERAPSVRTDGAVGEAASVDASASAATDAAGDPPSETAEVAEQEPPAP